MVEFVQHAEQLGLDEIWLGDEGPARDPLSVLAGMDPLVRGPPLDRR